MANQQVTDAGSGARMGTSSAIVERLNADLIPLFDRYKPRSVTLETFCNQFMKAVESAPRIAQQSGGQVSLLVWEDGHLAIPNVESAGYATGERTKH